jgi:pyruvate dehydrogenase E2 component (dihydrolipoamide acetyltransferase)
LTEFKVPELGENVAGGDVTRVLVNVGDTIARDQPVLELETDKATIEVPSSVAGVVKAIAVKKGDKIKVGATVLTVDDAASGNGAGKASASAPSAATDAKPVDASTPASNATADNPNAEATKPALQEEAAKVISMPSRPGASAQKSEPEPAPLAKPVERPGGPAAPASPAVRRLAREIGVDINSVQGSGPAGRISLDDVKEQARRILSSVGSAAAGAGGGARAARSLPDFAKWGEVDRQPWSNIRRATSPSI